MIIDLIIWLPILTGFMIIALGEKRSELSYRISLFISILVFMFSVYVLYLFDPTTSGFQFVIKTQRKAVKIVGKSTKIQGNQ